MYSPGNSYLASCIQPPPHLQPFIFSLSYADRTLIFSPSYSALISCSASRIQPPPHLQPLTSAWDLILSLSYPMPPLIFNSASHIHPGPRIQSLIFSLLFQPLVFRRDLVSSLSHPASHTHLEPHTQPLTPNPSSHIQPLIFNSASHMQLGPHIQPLTFSQDPHI